ncbi:beta-N-acetylhexosaminidase [Porticoccaceae bacterium]|nr:beta-N-acetylhexosaminidase [Porticoccaceae bacterium]MDA8936339.1 beta-N-acetylhexosaminidase [Porticoccaceae bacterium]MDA9559708.1 beta-N-acetylhexosaminidase [Porticoccaceae bacterium]
MAYGRLMLDLAGTELTAEEQQILQSPQVGGVILFARNIQSREQVTALNAQIRQASANLLIAVDQEGGRVQRLRDGFTPLPPMQLLADSVVQNSEVGVQLVRDTGWLMASEVLACGFDISFAPVLDVDRDTSSIISDRAFSDQPEMVITLAQAFIEGMNEAGMAATGKHFPGHGGIVADSHLEAPVDHRSWQQLLDHDLKPFVALSKQLAGVMPAHITFPAVDPDSVGFSGFWLQQVLRQQLGFDGVIFSDDLSMKGADVAGGYIDKAQLALNAGCDMILVCNCPEGAREVLQMMEHRSLAGSDRIASMGATKSVDWDKLCADSRRTRVVQQLKDISRSK